LLFATTLGLAAYVTVMTARVIREIRQAPLVASDGGAPGAAPADTEVQHGGVL
jgi:hypothetical protein